MGGLGRDELVHQALGGSMFMTGTADGPPLCGFGERAGYARGSRRTSHASLRSSPAPAPASVILGGQYRVVLLSRA
jgi:hypothetical protein